MDAPASLHPTDQTLQSYGLGRLDDASAEPVHEHLEHCPACRRRVAELSSDRFLGRIREARDSSEAGASRAAVRGQRGTASGASSGEPSWLESVPPELIEHPQYELIRGLGHGGMGVVYLAKNRSMDRLEVLRVLNPDMLGRRGTLDRFLREIRSGARLARLSHSKVVAALPLGRPIGPAVTAAGKRAAAGLGQPLAEPAALTDIDGSRRPLIGTDSTQSTTDERDAAIPNRSTAGWRSLPGDGPLHAGNVGGAPPEGQSMLTFLCSRPSYRDVEPRIEVGSRTASAMAACRSGPAPESRQCSRWSVRSARSWRNRRASPGGRPGAQAQGRRPNRALTTSRRRPPERRRRRAPRLPRRLPLPTRHVSA